MRINVDKSAMISVTRTKLTGLIVAVLCLGAACAYAQDAYEPDNTFAAATTSELSIAQLHTIAPANDSDWFTFIPQTGHVYRIETYAGPIYGDTVDTVIELWNEDVTVRLDENDDAFPANFFSRIDYTAVTTNRLNFEVRLNLPTEVGDYYIEVSDLTGAGGGGGPIVVYPPHPLTGMASNTAITMDNDGFPVIAYTDDDTNGVQQVYVIRWDFPIDGVVGDWVSLLGHWVSADKSVGIVDQVSSAGVWAGAPSIDVFDDEIYVAWLNLAVDGGKERVFLSHFDGSSWSELGGSMTDTGITPPSVGLFDSDCAQPVVKVTSAGVPVVAYRNAFFDGSDYIQTPCVQIHQGGTNGWLGMDGSTNGVVDGGEIAIRLAMDLDASDNPVVVWGDPMGIRSRRWAGSSWVSLASEIPGTPYASQPSLAVYGNTVYVAWKGLHVGDIDWLMLYQSSQVRALQTTIGSGSWSGMGDSNTPEGLSRAPAGGEHRPSSISIDVNPSTGRPMVSWVAGSVSNAIYLRAWDGASWAEIDGSATGNGIPNEAGSFSAASLAVDDYGFPAVVFANADEQGTNTLKTYMVVPSDPPAPPLFGGVKVARAETNGGDFVYLEWSDAEPPYVTETYTSVRYNVYQSTRTSWVFAGTPSYSEDDVFGSGSVFLGSTNIPIAALTNSFLWPVPASDLNRVWGFGVRAVSPNTGMEDENKSIRYAGVSNFVASSALPTNDTDGDGLDDIVDPAPNDPDANDNGVSDGDERQAGYTDAEIVAPNVLYDDVLAGDDVNFTGGEGGWTHTSAIDLWHRTQADPDPPTGTRMHEHTAPWSFRCAKNVPADDTSTTYSQGSAFIHSALDSPTFNPGVRANLFVRWNEFFITEAKWDICSVAVSDDGANWTLVRSGVSGSSVEWLHRTVDITEWWRSKGSPAAGIQVRFEFQTINNINNEFGGWYVDDVNVYGTPEVVGKIRSESGDPLEGAVVYAIGKGGVTNIVDGHAYVAPGSIIAMAVTDANGDYELRSMPEGRYYIKAVIDGFKAEFWDGQLYVAPYINAFGGANGAVNPGKHDVRAVSALGFLDLTAASTAATCNFEMDPGLSRGSLVIQTLAGSYNVYLNQSAAQEQIWNGTATSNGAAFIDYTTDMADTSAFPDIDWAANPALPPEMSDLMSGSYDVFLYPGWAAAPDYSKITADVREGEKTKVVVGVVSASGGDLNILTEDDVAATVYINGRATAFTTPILISGLQAGVHDISLVTTGAVYSIEPKSITVSTNGIANLYFNSDELSGAPGSAYIRGFNVHGVEITGSAVYINGFDTGMTTPVTIPGLMAGSHELTLRTDGYMNTPLLQLAVLSGQTTAFSTTVRVSDRDYDSVGDAFEVEGYGRIFDYDADDDPDGDGVSNFNETEQFRLHGISMDINNADTDGDGMSDGQEFAYDGLTNRLALSVLAADASVRETAVQIMFNGSYLAGVSFFPSTGPMSIEGDRFEATGLSWTTNSRGRPVMVYAVDVLGDDESIVNISHNLNEAVFADPTPTDEDSDDDDMWDGYEFLYESVDGIDVLDNTGADYDPDLDGLSNLREFLGVDAIASGLSNSWSNPGLADTDGDGIPDGWEYEYGLDPVDPADALFDEDLDGPDGLNNFEEWINRTDPFASDSDNDFVIDGAEVNVYGTDPLAHDTDLDGLWDGQEVIDTDLDESNGLDGGFFPNWNGGDFDFDGFIDGPTDWDTDGDGMPDGFEVLTAFNDTNGMRIIRDGTQRLNPMDQLDGTADEDGDGLSNLEEWLVRDNLTGINPDGLVWDYPSDPFDPDSDGDGMPDGWEVWRGLHPQDPIPSLRSETQWAIREEDYWRYGDLDGDGLDNIDEYEMRFVMDADADQYAIEGSADPWDPDSDDDGVPDGDEIKSYRTSPMAQDSDGDGLIDGIDPAGLRQGEVNSSTNINAGGHYDRALNDMWQLGVGRVYNPLTESHWIGYEPFFPDAAPGLQPVYRHNPAGQFAIDITNAPMVNNWALSGYIPAPPTGPADYYSWTRKLKKDPTETGFDDIPGRGQGLLSFYLDIQQAGTYQIRLYNMVTSILDEEDTVWINLDFGPWIAVEPNPNDFMATVDTWSWDTKLASGLGLSQYLEAGIHRLYISARGNAFSVARLLVYDDTVGSAAAEVADLSTQVLVEPDPVATLFYSIPTVPERRWGAKAARVKFTIMDDDDGTYVGAPVGHNVKRQRKQTLLRTDQYLLVGGRDGGHFYDQIWVLKGMMDWVLDSVYGAVDPRGTMSAGRSELLLFAFPQVCPSGPGNWGGVDGVVRPRPGVPPGYQYYDGDSGTDPAEIWGENGTNNMVPMGYFTGFDNINTNFYYYPIGNNTKEAVEKWKLPYNNNFIPYYLHEDDFSQATYEWAAGNVSYQWLANSISSNAPNELINTGGYLAYDAQTVPGVTNQTIVGLQVENILNTKNSSDAGTLFSALSIVSGFRTNTAPMILDVFAEVSLREVPSVPNPDPHQIWSSNPSYGVNGANARDTDFTPLRRENLDTWDNFLPRNEAYYKTTNIQVTIPVQKPGDVFGMDVTPLVNEIFQIVHPSGVWELGGNIGFVLKPQPVAGTTNQLVISDHWMTVYARAPFWEWPAAGGYWVSGDKFASKYTPNQISIMTSVSGATEPTYTPFPRKSSANVIFADGLLLFGGVDGNNVLNDTWASDGLVGEGSISITWALKTPVNKPVGRWGHGMAESIHGAVMFGGFDVNNEPLNDLWLWENTLDNWYEITNFANVDSGEYITDPNRPNPRGGHIFHKINGRPSIFGGTDGQFYYNDAWVLQEGQNPSTVDLNDPDAISTPWRWILANPYGERSGTPPARAFAAFDGQYMFGGRTGTLPTSKDTDNDWVDDGMEHSLGGPDAGRDPRVNALFDRNGGFYPILDWGFSLNTNAAEKIPFAFQRLGGYSWEEEFWSIPGTPAPGQYNAYPRGAVADFEALSFSHERSNGDLEFEAMYGGAPFNTPIQGHRMPSPTIPGFEMRTGFDGMLVSFTNLWYRAADLEGGWELGPPQSGTPKSARSGRWCYGTDLKDFYNNDAVEELYSPILQLTLPFNADESTDTSNNNGIYLVFHEYLDLNDSGDNVRVEAIRPTTAADILTRVSGQGRPTVTVLPDRNNSFNTTDGQWRRVVVSLEPLQNQENVYLKFVFESDGAGRANGWFIDDVAILQSGEISGILNPATSADVYLFGDTSAFGTNNVINDPIMSTVASGTGGFGFSGLIPAGKYKLMSDTGSSQTTDVGLSGSWTVAGLTVDQVDRIIIGITVNSPALLTWNSIPGVEYLVFYATPQSLATGSPWQYLSSVTPTGRFGVYRDEDSDGEQSRYYKIMMVD